MTRPRLRPPRVLYALAMLAWACAGSPAKSAAAAPRHHHPARHPARHAPRWAPVIGGSNVDRVKLRWEAAVGGFGRAVAIDRALGRVAVATGSPVKLFDLGTGKDAGSVDSCRNVVRGGIAFDKGKLLVVCEKTLQLFDGKKLAHLHAPRINPSPVTASAVAWPRIALGHHDGVIRVYDLDGGDTIEIPVPGPPIDVKSMAMTPDGSRVAVAWVQGSIWWWDTKAPGVPHKLVRHESEADAVSFNDGGTLLAEEGEPRYTTVWTFAGTPAEKTKIKNGRWVKRIWFTKDSKWLVRGGSDGLEIAEIAGPQRVALDTSGKVEDVAMDDRRATIAAVDRAGRLTTWAAR